MTDGLEDKGYHVYVDNFFTTERVMRDMYKKKIYCCGTVRQNRKHFPKLKTDKALTRGEWDWSTRRAMLSCVKWKDKSAVTVASTIHNPEENSPVGKKEKDGSITQLNCPISVKNHRRCMGGVDRADMHKSYYGILLIPRW
ncbi:hypothetical protein JTB14_012245 [Gonioctena quinquepunctata]|nr:hypothetical protein JTB14_012245 [Gonioctena quinquepunctata]